MSIPKLAPGVRVADVAARLLLIWVRVGPVTTSGPVSPSKILTSRATLEVVSMAPMSTNDRPAPLEGHALSSSSSKLSPSEPLSESSLSIPWSSSSDEDALSDASLRSLGDASGCESPVMEIPLEAIVLKNLALLGRPGRRWLGELEVWA